MLRFVVEASAKRKAFINDRNGHHSGSRATRSGGIVTVIDPSLPGLSSAEELVQHRREGRYSIVRLAIGPSVVYIHNIYVPNDSRERSNFFAALPRSFPEDVVHIACGDFNLTLNPSLDALRPASDPSQAESDYVFSGPTRANRIDYIAVSEDLCTHQYADSEYVKLDKGGDHLGVQLQLTSWHHPRGPASWRVPRWLLDNEGIRDEIRTAAAELLRSLPSSDNPGVLWSAWKYRVRKYLQRQCSFLRARNRHVHDALVRRLERLSLLRAVDSSPAVAIAWYSAKRYVELMLEEREVYRRSHHFDYLATAVETNSSAFFRPPEPARRVPLDRVELQDGTVSTDPATIYETFQQKWGCIFGDKRLVTDSQDVAVDLSAQDQLVNAVEDVLAPAEALDLDSEFTKEEFTEAIISMRSDGAPGPDGLTARFYQIAPDIFGEVLARVFDGHFQCGTLLSHQNLSEVFLLHKKGSRARVENYRPISLMPVEVKVLSRVLVERLKPLMHKLVHEDQQGFIPGRSLHRHLLLLSDLQAFCQSTGQSGFVAFLDFEKAYDRVDWKYLLRVMERQGFGPRFLKWIHILYSKPACSLMLDGWSQPKLFPSRGVKQGDPLSPYLFLLAMVPLGVLLRRRPDVGIPLPMRRIATNLFVADDSLLLAASIEGVHAQLQTVQVYCAGSGAKLNASKSRLLSLSDTSARITSAPLPVVAANERVRYLGIDFGYNVTAEATERDLDKKLSQALRRWQYRARTFEGRKLLVTTMVLSLLWYKALHLVIRPTTIHRWQRMIIDFVVYKKVPPASARIRLTTAKLAVTPTAQGGLGVPELALFLTRHKMRLFQEFAATIESSTTSTIPLWAVLPLWAAYGGEISHSTRLDDIFYLSVRGRPPGHVTPWWKWAWRQWHELAPRMQQPPMPNTLHQRRLLHAPLWCSILPRLQIPSSSRDHFEPLSDGLPTFQAFCDQLERLGYRSLFDFLEPIGVNFSLAAFMHCFLGRHELFRFRDAHAMLMRVFQRLSVVIHAITTSAGGLLVVLQRPDSVAGLLGVTTQSRFRFFPHLRKQDWSALLRPPTSAWESRAKRLHCDVNVLKGHSSQLALVKRWMLPTTYDIQFRVLHELMHVNSKRFFLQTGRRDPTTCPRQDCYQRESLAHCFWLCSPTQQTWSALRPIWSLLLRRTPSWLGFLLGTTELLHSSWAAHQELAYGLRLILRGIFMRATWINRTNDAFGREAASPKAIAAGVKSSFVVHLRSLNRRSHMAKVDTATLCSFIQHLVSEDDSTCRCTDTPRPGVPLWIAHQLLSSQVKELQVVTSVLRRLPALEALHHLAPIVSSFLGPAPTLSLARACELGSIELLDWIWSSSCTSAAERPRGWSLTNYLRSDPHYYRWQFAEALEVAAGRGDLTMVQWLFTQFSGCLAPVNVVEAAAKNGHEHILDYLLEHDAGAEFSYYFRKAIAVRDAFGFGEQAPIERVPCLPDDWSGPGNALTWGGHSMLYAVENKHLDVAIWMFERADQAGLGIDYGRGDEANWVVCAALDVGFYELAAKITTRDRDNWDEWKLEYSLNCPIPENIEVMLQNELFQAFERAGRRPVRVLARTGHLELLQRVLQVYEPLSSDNLSWQIEWLFALAAACKSGHLPVIKLMMEHPIGDEIFQQKRLESGSKTLLKAAAEQDSIEVLEYLFAQGLRDPDGEALCTMVRLGKLEQVKWMLQHTQPSLMTTIFCVAAAAGQMEIMQYLLAVTSRDGSDFELKRDRVLASAASLGQLQSLEWLFAHGFGCCDEAFEAAAQSGNLNVIQWLIARSPAECTQDALDLAARNGHIIVVKWLYENQLRCCSREAFDEAVKSGHVQMVCFLRQQYPDHNPVQGDLPRNVANDFDLLLFLYLHYPAVFTPETIARAMLNCIDAAYKTTVQEVFKWLENLQDTVVVQTEQQTHERAHIDHAQV